MILPLVTLATSAVVSSGTGTIVGHAIKHVTPIATMTPLKKVSVIAAGVALSGAAGGAASRYTTKTIEEAVAGVKTFKQTYKDAKNNR